MTRRNLELQLVQRIAETSIYKELVRSLIKRILIKSWDPYYNKDINALEPTRDNQYHLLAAIIPDEGGRTVVNINFVYI